MKFRHQVVSGVVWTSVARVIQQVAQFAISVFLARLLSPQHFGLIGMVLVFSGFAEVFVDLGLQSALVQKQNIEERHLQSVFWLTLTSGGVLTVLFLIAAPLIADFYRVAEITPICRTLAFAFLINSVGVVPRALLQKTMAFDRLAKVEIATSLLPGAMAIGLALCGWGVWCLVVQTLVSRSLSSAGVLYLCQWRPRLATDRRAVAELFRYGRNLTGFGFVNYWARNADNMVIGKMLGSASLGIYTRAYALMLLPISQIISIISDVMFSALSAIQDDKLRVKTIYLRATRAISLFSFPAMMGMLVVAKPFIFCVYGTKWAEVIPLLQILCVVGLFQSLMNPTGWVYTSQGRTDWMFRWGIFGAGTLVVAILVGAAFRSVSAIAIAYTIGNLLLFYPCIAIPGRLIRMSFAEVMKAVAGTFACAITMATLVCVAGWALPLSSSNWSRLAVQVPLGIVSYSAFVVFFKLGAYEDLRELARERSLLRRQAGATVVESTA